MKHTNKKLILLALMITSLLVTACGKDEPDEESDFITPPPVTTEKAKPTPEISFTPGTLKTITYYTISDSMLKEEATAVLAADTVLTPEYLARYVADSMEDASVTVEIDSVSVEKELVVVSFAEDSMPVCDTKAELEGEILDAIAQSILENLEEYTGVIFRVLDGHYISENRSYDKNSVYLSH
ncbi:MAG: hypothetical protein IJY09_09590 [Lachnospiraceae bacterium]|nr:hypothetical protein [Lachnospiraceae bacterium]